MERGTHKNILECHASGSVQAVLVCVLVEDRNHFGDVLLEQTLKAYLNQGRLVWSYLILLNNIL